jgi:hypothetical protein
VFFGADIVLAVPSVGTIDDGAWNSLALPVGKDNWVSGAIETLHNVTRHPPGSLGTHVLLNFLNRDCLGIVSVVSVVALFILTVCQRHTPSQLLAPSSALTQVGSRALPGIKRGVT